jgi:tetratricopeptide (TPR) repeat protein
LLLVRARTAAAHDLDEALRWNQAAEAWFVDPPRVLYLQRADLLAKSGQAEAAQTWRRTLGTLPDEGPRDLAGQASELAAQGRPREALPLLERATRLDPRDFWAWFDRGLCHEALEQDADARACFSAALALAPEFAPTAFKCGLAALRLHRYAEAEADFERALALQPRFVEARLNRALARIGQARYDAALGDLDALLAEDNRYTRVWFLRARVRGALGDRDGALRDRQEGLRREPTDDASWVARGVARLPDDPTGALADFEAALRLQPRSRAALQNRAHVLSEHLDRPEEALATLEQLLQLYADALPARRGRAVLLARLGRRAEAHAAAQDCLARDGSPATLYQLAGVHALTSRQHPADRDQALRLLTIALQMGYGAAQLADDRDLDPLRDDPEFQVLVQASRSPRREAGEARQAGPVFPPAVEP